MEIAASGNRFQVSGRVLVRDRVDRLHWDAECLPPWIPAPVRSEVAAYRAAGPSGSSCGLWKTVTPTDYGERVALTGIS